MAPKRLKTASITTSFSKKARTLPAESDATMTTPVPVAATLADQCMAGGLEWCSLNGIPENPVECSIADFVKADPADRPPNLFRIKQLTDSPELLRQVLRAYARQGPFQPHQDVYEPRVFGQRSRSFQYAWFERCPWLEYSPKTNAAYCFCCYLCREVMTLEDELSVFTRPVVGYCNWKKAMSSSGFTKHIGDRCSKHNTAEAALNNLVSTDQDVWLALQHHSGNERQQNRQRIEIILEICLFLARQGLPFRGHDERHESMNRGNFLEMVRFTAERFPEFSLRMAAAGYNAKYTSSSVQYQLVGCATDAVRQHVLANELGDGYFALLVDEASCEAKSEHMAIVIRFVCRLTGRIMERFLGTVHVKDTSATTLFSCLESQLTIWGLRLSRCRGQGFDVAANMAGDFNGLQQRVRAVCPYAYFVHCFAHRLNLVLVAVAKNTVSVVECLDTVQSVHTTCSASCKRKDRLLESAACEKEQSLRDGYLETGKGLNQPLSTESLSKTRWNCRVRALLRIRWLWFPITTVLNEISVSGVNAEKRAEASGILDRMWTSRFVFHVEVLIVVLEKANTHSMYLQRKNVDIASAARLVEQVAAEFVQMRENALNDNDEAGFDSIWERVVQFCEAVTSEGDEPLAPRKSDPWARRGARWRGRGRPGVPGSDAPRTSPRTTQEDHYRNDIYMAILNDVISELKFRFSGAMIRLMGLCGSVSPKRAFHGWNADDVSRIAAEYYADDFTDMTESLRREAERFGQLARKDDRFSGLTTTEDLSIAMVKHDMHTIFPSLYRLVCLVCVLPVSTSSAECSFSAMKRIKTRLRTTLGHEWLSNLLVLALERDLSNGVDKDAIIDAFNTMTERRVAL